MLGERLEGYVRGHQRPFRRERRHQHVSVRGERDTLEDTSTLVLGEMLEGYFRGHQHPSVRVGG